MELWFILSLAAAIFAGLQIFTQKIGAIRGYNSSLINSYGSGISAFGGLCIAAVFEGFREISVPLVALSALNGTLYIVGQNFRMDALRYIDTTISLPLHKFISPLIALLIGVLFFKELLGISEWTGIFLGMIVPLILINRSEKIRQNNLVKGLIFISISALLGALAAAVSKEGTNLFASVLLFAAVSNVFATIVGVTLYVRRKKDVIANMPETHFFDPKLLLLAFIGGIITMFSYGTFIFAFAFGGALAIVYTIHSLYILIPIVLSIIFFNEHWNLRKVTAIALSLAAIVLMR